MKLVSLAIFLGSLGGYALLPGCSKPAPAATSAEVDYYTCTMHPSVHSKIAGTCPICGMDLVPVAPPPVRAKAPEIARTATETSGAASEEPHEFTVPLDRQQMIGVTYSVVETRPLHRSVRAVGRVAATTSNHWDYVARVEGYVHALFVFAPGDVVRKGQVLLDLYSPDVAATEGEYLDLLRMRDQGRRAQNSATVGNAERLLAGARARLRQWNISEGQINAVEKAGVAEQYLPLDSPVDGVVQEVAVHQGRHIAVGDHLVDIVNLSAVWVWAEFYENELPLLRAGSSVTMSSAALPNHSIAGKIARIDPFLNPETRTVKVRIDVPNLGGQLRPDAYVDVVLLLDEGTGLTVPSGAVLPTGERNIVFVDLGGGKLQPRFVQLGGKFGDFYQVTAGLRAGERVVASGNFLIDAESKVQGALKDF